MVLTASINFKGTVLESLPSFDDGIEIGCISSREFGSCLVDSDGASVSAMFLVRRFAVSREKCS